MVVRLCDLAPMVVRCYSRKGMRCCGLAWVLTKAAHIAAGSTASKVLQQKVATPKKMVETAASPSVFWFVTSPMSTGSRSSRWYCEMIESTMADKYC